MSDQHEKNPDYVARGLKAAIHNPNVSEGAKDNAAQRLEKMGVTPPAEYDGDESGRHQNAGYRANPDTSPETKEYSQSTLEQAEDDQNLNRVLGGYKATLKNPNTSGEAKGKAEKILREYDEEI